MPRPPHRHGAETRAEILRVALELFTERGYDTTSLRDISGRLGITKAALYYYFERKEDILLELHLGLHAAGSDLLDELEATPDGPERVAAWPRLVNRLVDFMIDNRELILLHSRNQSAFETLARSDRNQHENEALEARLVNILSSTAIPLRERVRMAATVGVLTEVLVESARAFRDVPSEEIAALVRETITELVGDELTRDGQADQAKSARAYQSLLSRTPGSAKKYPPPTGEM